ncbi:hypothetical protein Tco_0045056 [Tanacetum coccineum]
MEIDEGFITVGRKNKSVEIHSRDRNFNFKNGNLSSMQSKGELKGGRNVKPNNGVGLQKKNFNFNVGISFFQGTYVRKSFANSGSNVDGGDEEEMGDINVDDEFESKVWPELKEEVDILLEVGIYPSKTIRLDWIIHQMNYFYKNNHKFHLHPICVDDEGDVESDVDGIATNMMPEFKVCVADNLVINAVDSEIVSNGS